MNVNLVDSQNRTVTIDGVGRKYNPEAVNWGDWCPWNSWEPAWSPSLATYVKDPQKGYWSASAIVDMTTGKPYGHEYPGLIRFKCFWLILGTPIVHAITIICNLVYRLFLLMTFAHFWADDQKYSFAARLLYCGTDLLRIVAAPLAIIGLELAALYGLFNPLDGRKLYATIERAEYGNFILAPCFQPDPMGHLFSGPIDEEHPNEPNRF
jgi:hypothetical protein